MHTASTHDSAQQNPWPKTKVVSIQGKLSTKSVKLTTYLDLNHIQIHNYRFLGHIKMLKIASPHSNSIFQDFTHKCIICETCALVA